MSSAAVHLAEARTHLLAIAQAAEDYVKTRSGWEIATPVVASALGLDHATMTGLRGSCLNSL